MLFGDNYELLHDRINIKGIRQITEKEYFVGGCTALLDAIGETIHKIANVQRHTGEEHRADKVMFVITTDGMENASREYNYEKIKEIVERQKEKYGWEFIFLGANIDAVSTAARFGIGAERTANYQAVSQAVTELRAGRPISDKWKAEIDEDFVRRGKKGKK